VPKRPRRWRRALEPGTWHAVELRVKLNAPDASDGVVEGWLDGEKAAALRGLRLRELPDMAVEHVAFEASFRGALEGGPAHEVEATFDDLVVARSYIGPRGP
jgi:hypothetical protein